MIRDGRALETFVKQIEEEAAAPGTTVEPRVKAYSEDGKQIAEFDIVVTGKFGTGDIKWLLECRDRPSEGAAPNSWIEQLIGRKLAHHFDRVTAVSTTGFAPGCAELATRYRIELRSVNKVDPSEFADWFQVELMECFNRVADLKHCGVEFAEEQSEAQKMEIEALLTQGANAMRLWSPQDQAYTTASHAFLALVSQHNLWDDLPIGQKKGISIVGEYPADDRFQIELDSGRLTVSRMRFDGELWVEKTLVPIAAAEEYSTVGEESEVIAQRVQYQLPAHGRNFALEIIRLPDGRQQVQMRVVD
jgi:hypothetical protein